LSRTKQAKSIIKASRIIVEGGRIIKLGDDANKTKRENRRNFE
jgi:hypothetical protein